MTSTAFALLVLSVAAIGCKERSSTPITADPAPSSSASGAPTEMASTISAASASIVASAPPAMSAIQPLPTAVAPPAKSLPPITGYIGVLGGIDASANSPDLAFGAGVSPPSWGGMGGAGSLANMPKLASQPKCAFPGGATSDDATVSLSVEVDAAGHAKKATVSSETPQGEGFGEAARRCILSSAFVPAKDASGSATSGTTTVTVHFLR